MTVEQTVNATYEDLEQVLLELGFQASRGLNGFGMPYVVYENKEYDAVIFLAAHPGEEKMYGGDYIVAVKTVEGRGVASRAAFDALLFRETRKEAQAA